MRMKNLKLLQPGMSGLLLFSLVACGSSSNGVGGGPIINPVTTPTVLASTPLDGAVTVPVNGAISATFSQAMSPGTLNANTFTVATAAGTPVLGTVSYANAAAVFLPSTPLPASTAFNATITTGAQSAGGTSLAARHAWSFTTGTTVVPGLPVNLGTAINYAILAKTGIATVPASVITGDLGLSPAAASYLTGFSLSSDPTNVFSTSPQVTGKLYAADYAVPTPSKLTTAVSDLLLAFTDAAGRAPGVTELGAGTLGGMTIPPGVYSWSSSLRIPADITLTGGPTAVWIFQIAGDLTLSNATHVFLAGGALAKNVFWQVSGMAELGTTAHCEGVILSQTGITLRTGASITGRLLAQTAVNLDASTVVQPAP